MVIKTDKAAGSHTRLRFCELLRQTFNAGRAARTAARDIANGGASNGGGARSCFFVARTLEQERKFGVVYSAVKAPLKT